MGASFFHTHQHPHARATEPLRRSANSAHCARSALLSQVSCGAPACCCHPASRAQMQLERCHMRRAARNWALPFSTPTNSRTAVRLSRSDGPSTSLTAREMLCSVSVMRQYICLMSSSSITRADAKSDAIAEGRLGVGRFLFPHPPIAARPCD